jgi:hypothetical protein
MVIMMELLLGGDLLFPFCFPETPILDSTFLNSQSANQERMRARKNKYRNRKEESKSKQRRESIYFHIT